MTASAQNHPKNMGPLYAALLASVWVLVHVYSLFFHNLSAPLWQTIGLILLQCWLYTGLFIVAHDTMHGSFWPNRPRLSAKVGTVILFVYAGFNWRYMRDAHHAHHDHPGSEQDPDFNANNPSAFWPWYFKFFTTYFGWKQFFTLFGFTVVYLLLGAPYLNTIIMWAVPAILSSVQLFYFGTYLTHKHPHDFKDHHNARSNDYNALFSLLSCFHFGYHHEHHLYPHEPWWRLPARKAQHQRQMLEQS